MQFAKDSFFLALQQRLAGLNPARTVTLNGTTVPAIAVVENLPPSSAEPQGNTFYIEWGEAAVERAHAGNAPLMSLNVLITYYTLGSVQSMVDRGRILAELDDELLGICQPPSTGKRDYTQAPSADLGTSVFWDQPLFADGDVAAMFSGSESPKTENRRDARVGRTARLTIYFFSEVAMS